MDSTHLLLCCPDQFPDPVVENIIGEIKAPNFNIKIQKIKPEPFAALEWVVPTMIATYLLKPYFESFFKEAGKDHYYILKNWLKKIVTNSRDITIKKISASQSIDKLDKNYKQSSAVSIVIKTKTNRTIKLLFDNNLAKEDWENAIDQLLSYVIENYEKYPNDFITENIKELEKDERFMIYAIINRHTKTIKFHDDKQLIDLQRKGNTL